MSKVIDVGAIGQANGLQTAHPASGQVLTQDGGSLEIITDSVLRQAPPNCHYYALLAVGSDVVLTPAGCVFLAGYVRRNATATISATAQGLTKDIARVCALSSVQRTSGGELWAFIRRNDSLAT